MLPPNSTPQSHARLPLAQELADACPPALGKEIALGGSVSRGWADDLSDIELNFWVETLDWPGDREAWLRSLGVERLIIDTEPHETGSWWIEFVYKDVWVEIGWHDIAHFDSLLHRIIAGEVENMYEMTPAEMLVHAITLRDGSNLPRWRDLLREYPETLRRATIALGIKDWSDPHWFELGALRILRPDPTIALLRTEATVRNVLRILFAANRQWQPDLRKWIRQWADTLDAGPDRLADRILTILERPIAPDSHADLLDLVAETLALVPREYGVDEIRRNVDDARSKWRDR
jgi:hypothetical protein